MVMSTIGTGVDIAGVAMTPFGRHPESIVELACIAGRGALEDAGIPPAAIGAVYVGNFMSEYLAGQGSLAPLVARRLGLGSIPATKVEGACASAGIALRHGIMAITSQSTDVVLAIGVEKMSHRSLEDVTTGLSYASDATSDGLAGLTFPGFFGLVARRHMAEFGTTRVQLDAVRARSGELAQNNPLAAFRRRFGVADFNQAPLIADPLRRTDCSPIADGAAAAVLVAANHPKSAASPARIRVLASEQASGPGSISEMQSLTSFPATIAAASAAYERSGCGPEDIDVVELHDCFSIAQIVDSEDLGLFQRGEAAAAIEHGLTLNGGIRPINPSGGLLGRGHPVGATGLAQIYELVQQLRGVGVNQVERAKTALAHNLGGSGVVSTVTILASR